MPSPSSKRQTAIRSVGVEPLIRSTPSALLGNASRQSRLHYQAPHRQCRPSWQGSPDFRGCWVQSITSLLARAGTGPSSARQRPRLSGIRWDRGYNGGRYDDALHFRQRVCSVESRGCASHGRLMIFSLKWSVMPVVRAVDILDTFHSFGIYATGHDIRDCDRY